MLFDAQYFLYLLYLFSVDAKLGTQFTGSTSY